MNLTTGTPAPADSDGGCGVRERTPDLIEGWVLMAAIVAFVVAVYSLSTAEDEELSRDRDCPCECGE